MYKIRKINFGWYKRRHGILLENLPPSKQQLILDNDYFRYLNEDVQALEVIFKVEDLNEHEKGLKKLFWNAFKSRLPVVFRINQNIPNYEVFLNNI